MPEKLSRIAVNTTRFVIEPIGYPISLIERHRISGTLLLGMSLIPSSGFAIDSISRGDWKWFSVSFATAWITGKFFKGLPRLSERVDLE